MRGHDIGPTDRHGQSRVRRAISLPGIFVVLHVILLVYCKTSDDLAQGTILLQKSDLSPLWNRAVIGEGAKAADPRIDPVATQRIPAGDRSIPANVTGGNAEHIGFVT